MDVNLNLGILAVPRAVHETIRSLDVNRLHDLRTASDIYWQCIDFMLEKAATSGLMRDSSGTITHCGF